MRFSQRSATQDPAARADLYGATIDMCAWAEGHGALAAILSQHHGSEDGYLPSPVPLAAAIAARTSTLPITVAALLLALYEPVKLAEDLAVVDLISRGRVSYVVGIGYRDEEFDMFSVDRRGRGHLVEERIGLLQRLWSGERLDLDGRPVRVTPLPFTPGGPVLAYGGGTEVAARRAGGWASCSWPSRTTPRSSSAYRAEGGDAAPGCFFAPAGVPNTVFVADDPSAPGPRSASTSFSTPSATQDGMPTGRAPCQSHERRRWPSWQRKRAPIRSLLLPKLVISSPRATRSDCSPWSAGYPRHRLAVSREAARRLVAQGCQLSPRFPRSPHRTPPEPRCHPRRARARPGSHGCAPREWSTKARAAAPR